MMDIGSLRAHGLYQILMIGAQIRRSEITGALVQAHGLNVSSGPFAGMILQPDVAWTDGDLAPRILGCYESELHPSITKAISRNPNTIINIGCAEGYYSVGMARALPNARVFAFDTNPNAQAICGRAAATNRVANRVSVEGSCGHDTLRRLLSENGKAFLIVDCEGAELQLLNPTDVPDLRRCDLIIECHDFVDASITKTLQQRFNATHDLENVPEGSRDPNQFISLRKMSSLDRWLAVNENRPTTMNWLVCWAR
jgi:hypothetical protein